MMLECEVKTGQTVESIEDTRRKECEGVGGKTKNRKMMELFQKQ